MKRGLDPSPPNPPGLAAASPMPGRGQVFFPTAWGCNTRVWQSESRRDLTRVRRRSALLPCRPTRHRAEPLCRHVFRSAGPGNKGRREERSPRITLLSREKLLPSRRRCVSAAVLALEKPLFQFSDSFAHRGGRKALGREQGTPSRRRPCRGAAVPRGLAASAPPEEGAAGPGWARLPPTVPRGQALPDEGPRPPLPFRRLSSARRSCCPSPGAVTPRTLAGGSAGASPPLRRPRRGSPGGSPPWRLEHPEPRRPRGPRQPRPGARPPLRSLRAAAARMRSTQLPVRARGYGAGALRPPRRRLPSRVAGGAGAALRAGQDGGRGLLALAGGVRRRRRCRRRRQEPRAGGWAAAARLARPGAQRPAASRRRLGPRRPPPPAALRRALRRG